MVIANMSVNTIPLIAKIVFWKAVYAGGDGTIADFNMSDMILYLVVFQFVAEFTYALPGLFFSIRFGGMTPQMLWPVSIRLRTFIYYTCEMFPRWTSAIVISAFLLVVFRNHIQLSPDWWIYPAGAVSTLLCYMLMYFYKFLLDLHFFWTESGIPLVDHVRQFFSGAVVPLAFFPGWLQDLAGVLPFKYMTYFPTTVFMGKISVGDFWMGTVLQCVWLALILVAIDVVWKPGMRRYNAYGG